MIQERQIGEKAESHDLFGALLEANDNSLDVTTLTESELIGISISSIQFLPKILLNLNCKFRKHIHISPCWTRSLYPPI